MSSSGGNGALRGTVFGYVGLWSLIQLFTVEFTVSGVLVGVVGVLLGYRILKTFYDITELGNAQLWSEKR